MDKFNVGDIVVLKSGGEIMTINELKENGVCNCVWHKDGKHYNHDYSQEILTIYDSSVRWGSNPKRNNHY